MCMLLAITDGCSVYGWAGRSTETLPYAGAFSMDPEGEAQGAFLACTTTNDRVIATIGTQVAHVTLDGGTLKADVSEIDDAVSFMG